MAMSRLGFAMAVMGLSLAASPSLAFTIVQIPAPSQGARFSDPKAALAAAGRSYQDSFVDNSLRYGAGSAAFVGDRSYNAPVTTSHFGPMTFTTTVSGSETGWMNRYGGRTFAPTYRSDFYEPIPGLPHR
jgi:hypothetical protein